jgi:hypothetical protein
VDAVELPGRHRGVVRPKLNDLSEILTR